MWWRIPAALLIWSLIATPQIVLIAGYRYYERHAEGLPAVPDLEGYQRWAPRTTRLVAADGTVLAEIPFVQGVEAGHRTWVRFRDIPPLVVQAILAAEDVRFFEHHGVDVRAVARAAWANYRAGKTVEGASTITQQVARNLLPEEIGRERSMARKIREAILARRIERSHDKARIFETWANQVFLGNNAYGLAAAARAYFDKRLDQLDASEAALIAGLAQAPGRADPTVDAAAAKARRDEVLDRMQRAGFLDEAARAAATASPIVLRRPVDPYGATLP
jgi:penicillin-binding protein 1A